MSCGLDRHRPSWAGAAPASPVISAPATCTPEPAATTRAHRRSPPALRAIGEVRRQAPSAQIDLVVGSWNAALANSLRDVDRVEVLDVPWMARQGSGATWATLIRRAWAWRRRQYDLGINFEGDIQEQSPAGRLWGCPARGVRHGGRRSCPHRAGRVLQNGSHRDNVGRLVVHAFGSASDSLDGGEPDDADSCRFLRMPAAAAEALLTQTRSDRDAHRHTGFCGTRDQTVGP